MVVATTNNSTQLDKALEYERILIKKDRSEKQNFNGIAQKLAMQS
jgi:hypothetical protein